MAAIILIISTVQMCQQGLVKSNKLLVEVVLNSVLSESM